MFSFLVLGGTRRPRWRFVGKLEDHRCHCHSCCCVITHARTTRTDNTLMGSEVDSVSPFFAGDCTEIAPPPSWMLHRKKYLCAYNIPFMGNHCLHQSQPLISRLYMCIFLLSCCMDACFRWFVNFKGPGLSKAINMRTRGRHQVGITSGPRLMSVGSILGGVYMCKAVCMQLARLS